MRHPFTIFALTAVMLTGCSAGSRSSAKASSSIVGTWQWVRVDQHAITDPFFVRYYPNGRAATWPAPERWGSTTNGVSHGGYHVAGGFLVIETGQGTNDPKTHIEIKGRQMILINNESNRLLYRRVIPDLEPGKLLPGQISHGAPEP